MAARDVVDASRALVHGRVKLCGLTRVEDVELAARCGATHAGLILVPGTPRAVTVDQARPLADAAHAHGLKTVGVFRDSPTADIASAAIALHLGVVQLHGDEDPAAVRAQLPPGTEIWAACPDGATARPGADRSLFDSGSGGTGAAFDWSLIKDRGDLASGFLAGGIASANARAASRVGTYGLDVGSSLEARPGEKDPAKVQALFNALRPRCRGDLA
jgi:indole-3-glycerol phosphate synthase/phosphoribosylanthranilate isomerase